MKITLEDYKSIFKYQVHWGDMDAANHVNNLAYLKWGESGRIHYFEKMGMNATFQKGSVGPILGWQDCKYIFPMTYPDTAVVGVKVLEILEDRFILETAIFSERHERLASLSKQQIIPYDYTDLKKVAIPEMWKAGIRSIED